MINKRDILIVISLMLLGVIIGIGLGGALTLITTALAVEKLHKYRNSMELIKQAYATLKPTPVNYNNAKISGWVD